MEEKGQIGIDEQIPIPAGFSLISSGPDACIIHHKRTGMGCMNAFFIIFLLGWSLGCVLLLHRYLTEDTTQADPVPLWVVAVFWLLEAFVAMCTTYALFCRKSFRIDTDCLTMETNVLGLRRRRNFPRDSIRHLVQVKDGGKGNDSFPSWGLRIDTDKETMLLARQPYEKSHWLGLVLAKWAQAEFIEAVRE